MRDVLIQQYTVGWDELPNRRGDEVEFAARFWRMRWFFATHTPTRVRVWARPEYDEHSGQTVERTYVTWWVSAVALPRGMRVPRNWPSVRLNVGVQ